MRATRIMPTTYLLLAMLAMIGVHLTYPHPRLLASPWVLVGILPILAGIALNLVADRALHRSGTAVKPLAESTALVTTGAYAVSRNPMYLGFVLILVGVGLLLGSAPPFAVVPIFAVFVDRVFIALEERKLAGRFGPDWEAYVRRTRRWA
jgi:protein-S-isoprenylcysteine O-methyltransferase Ste14